MFQLISDFPWWSWLLCFLLGAVYAVAMYVRERKLELSWKPLRYILMLFRFLVISIAAILLLEPYLRTSLNEEIRPLAILVQDNSASVALKLEDTAAYQHDWQSFAEKLEAVYDVETYTFGQDLEAEGHIDFTDAATDMSSALTSINQLYRFANVGAVVMSGDGIYNAGENPLYVHYDINAPIYTVALGDTTTQRDLRVIQVLANQIVFTGDQFNVHAEMGASLAKGSTVQYSIREIKGDQSKTLGSGSSTVKEDIYQFSHDFTLQASTPGLHHFKVVIETISGEANVANNTDDVFIEVLDARQKILLLADGPHPDIAAIRTAIEKNKNYDLTVQLARDYQSDLSQYSLIILHSIPSSGPNNNRIVQDCQQVNTPLWIITGESPDMSGLNNLQTLVRIQGGNSKGDEVTASGNLGFNLFVMESERMATFAKFPPLLSPYGEYSIAANTQVLFFQKLGTVSTRKPLLLFSQPGTRKTALLCGENLWRWRMNDFLLHNNHEAFDELISKTIQYLATKEDQKPFRVRASKSVYSDFEQVRLDAELYNEAFELINHPEATCIVTGSDGKEYPYTFSKAGKRYVLDAGFLPAGNYTVVAKTNYNNKGLQDQTAFSVHAEQLETSHTVADHRLMYGLADGHLGAMFYPSQLDALADTLLASSYAIPTLQEKIKTRSVINLSWILFLMIFLLGLEWWIRKWSGGY